MRLEKLNSIGQSTSIFCPHCRLPPACLDNTDSLVALDVIAIEIPDPNSEAGAVSVAARDANALGD